MESAETRRVERIEERLIEAERSVTALSSELHLTKENLARRLDDLNQNLKTDAEHVRMDLRERIADLKTEVKADLLVARTSVSIISRTITEIKESLQTLHITQKGVDIKATTNEKIIWAVVGVLVAAGLYLLQVVLKNGNGV
jgi:AraC-like DNA-binding protein